MAAAFLRTHGIDLDAEMTRLQDQRPSLSSGRRDAVSSILDASLHGRPAGSTWDLAIHDGHISSIRPASSERHSPGPATIHCHSALVAPSLCHPHIHLDKAFLLSHPAHSHLQIERGDFAEAMELTGKAKSRFQHADLIERGQRVIDESVAAGVTHMRAFVEMDAGVGLKCLEAGLELKRAAEEAGACIVQICAFAQLPLFSSSPGDEDGGVIRRLMEQAAAMQGVDVVGSTPYVEVARHKTRENIEWMVDLSRRYALHLDFHLDYTLDKATEPTVWQVVRTLKARQWPQAQKVALGHCTRLTLFSDEEWQKLKIEIGDLPISFVGLPTSDLFMMRTPDRARGTLDIPRLIQKYDLNACMGINNIGNAFTPHGSCDPLTLACNGVGIYQAGTKRDAELLYECISTRAREAIGLSQIHDGAVARTDLEVRIGDRAELLIFKADESEWRVRRSISEAVYLYDHCSSRRSVLGRLYTRPLGIEPAGPASHQTVARGSAKMVVFPGPWSSD